MKARQLTPSFLTVLMTATIAVILLTAPTKTFAAPVLHIVPETILQGDPIMITVSGESASAGMNTPPLPVKSSMTFPAGTAASASTPLYFFLYKNVPTALYGSDLNQATGTTTVTVTLANGTKLTGTFVIMSRVQQQESLPVPAQVGGNSVTNQDATVTELEKENVQLAAVYSRTDKALWTSAFAFPVAAPVIVTDPYGYDRDSGAATIAHKGTDFHAPPGTPVYAINRGVVRVAKTFTEYGNTVIVDHGLGVLSMYMHLSKIDVIPGQLVQKGQLVGLSGETGYAEGPHLHLTIRINGISVDPIAFYALFGVKAQ